MGDAASVLVTLDLDSPEISIARQAMQRAGLTLKKVQRIQNPTLVCTICLPDALLSCCFICVYTVLLQLHTCTALNHRQLVHPLSRVRL